MFCTTRTEHTVSPVQKRDLIFRDEMAKYGDINSAGTKLNVLGGPTRNVVVGHQETLSEGHQISLLGKTDRDIGGEFFSTSNYYRGDGAVAYHVDARKKAVIPKQYYDGPLFARGVGLWPTLSVYSLTSLLAAGTTAIARTIPTNPVASAGQFIGELYNDGVPSIIGSGLLKSRLKQYREYGSEYLNYQFGWVPFINDLLKFAEAVKHSDEYLQQLKRDSGKNVRRRYTFPTVSTTTQSNDGGGPPYSSPALPTSCVDGSVTQGNRTTTTIDTMDRWFSGCYTYHIDLGRDTLSNIHRCAQEANKLFGIALTPELVWQLTPWSWAADWVSNIGDVIHNISAFQQDGLVLRWGYIMEKSVKEVTYTLSDYKLRDYGPIYLRQTFGTTRKVRLKATPYGFGLNIAGFTPRQWAILVALGISRGPGKVD